MKCEIPWWLQYYLFFLLLLNSSLLMWKTYQLQQLRQENQELRQQVKDTVQEYLEEHEHSLSVKDVQ